MINEVDIPKVPTWMDHVINLEVGQELPAAFSKKNTLRSNVNRMKYLYPERVFETETVTEKDKKYIIVRRTA